MPQNDGRVGTRDPMLVENFAGQIKPLPSGVLVEIAQDVGQLQCPAKRFRDQMSGTASIAKDMHREMADGARDTGTIKVEHREIRGPNVFPGIHLHPVDNRQKIMSAQAIAQRRLAQCRGYEKMRPPTIESVDLLAPYGESGELVLHRPVVIGDVVDLAAEGINRIHPVATILRQQPHGPVERATGRLDPMPDGFAQRVVPQLVGHAVQRRIAHPRTPPDTPITKAAKKSDFRSLTRLATGSPRRSRRNSRTASSTMTPHSQRKPEEAMRGGRARQWSTSAAGRPSSPSSTRRRAGLDAPAANASTPVPAVARSIS